MGHTSNAIMIVKCFALNATSTMGLSNQSTKWLYFNYGLHSLILEHANCAVEMIFKAYQTFVAIVINYMR